jgi:hypothetical protein
LTEREGKAMHCQCCGRAILAKRGTIAYHGYERPAHGWQTGSCPGAKALPFEVSRTTLGSMIDGWRLELEWKQRLHSEIAAEKRYVVLTIEDRTRTNRHGNYPKERIEVVRYNFDAKKAENSEQFLINGYDSFDQVKQQELAQVEHEIAQITRAIEEQQARYDGWKQTHKRENDTWVEVR